MCILCTLVIVGGAEHVQTFNFGTAGDSNRTPLPSKRVIIKRGWGKFA